MSRPMSCTEHGTYGYARRTNCGCAPCKHAIFRYAKDARADKANGVTRRVPVGPSRAHLLYLISLGGSQTGIVAACGGRLTRTQFAAILEGRNQRTGKPHSGIYRATEQLILSLQPRDVLGYEHSLVSRVGVIRRIRALEALGHTKEAIAEEWGVSTSRVYQLISAHEQLKVATVEQFIAVYDRMCMKHGTNETIRWRAIRTGWVPPLAWEDGAIDDPDANPNFRMVACVVDRCTRPYFARGLCKLHHRMVPKDIAPDRFRRKVLALGKHAPAGTGQSSTLLEDLAELKGLGLSPQLAAAQLGRGVSYVEKIWSKA